MKQEDKDLRIVHFVELFFDGILYSERNEKIKEDIIEKLVKEEISFEKIVQKYNSLEKLCLFAGYSKEDVKKMESPENIISYGELKQSFKKKRRQVYGIGISIIVAFVYFLNTIFNFHIVYALLTLLFLFIVTRSFVKSIRKIKKVETYSMEAFDFIKILHDKYTKKTMNSVSLLIIFLAFYIIEFYSFGIHSKLEESIELLSTSGFYLEILFLIVFKNCLLVRWINQKIGKEEKTNHFKKNFEAFISFSTIYWIVYLVLCILFVKKSFINLFLLFILFYAIVYFIYIFNYRKKITYQNIVVNKKRIAFYSILVIFIFLYSFMQRDFWLLQPYINSIPNIGTSNNTITYDDETGVYTIVDEDGGDFKILQLTDIHLGGSIFSYAKDKKALEATYQLIDYTRPDFVIVTGDLTFPLGVMSFSFNNHTPVMQFASFMRNIGIPWAFTYGNHDTETLATYSKESLNDLYKSLSYKTSKNLLYPYVQPNITGRNNQLIEIRNKNGSLNQALFLIDSNAYTEEGMNEYDYIHDDQVEWYKDNILRLEKEEHQKISSMVFIHIPLQQYKNAYELYEKGSDEVTYYFGSNDEEMIDKVCASKYPSKIFDVALDLGSTKAFFCGHDHYNNMSLGYKGIRLTYGMSIDYLAMPGISKDIKQRGATLITLHEDSTYDIKQVPLISIQK